MIHLATSCRTKTKVAARYRTKVKLAAHSMNLLRGGPGRSNLYNSAQHCRVARVIGASLMISPSRSDVLGPYSCGRITLLAEN
jgi:hypothetical protein